MHDVMITFSCLETSGSSGRSNVQPVNPVMEDLRFLGRNEKPLGTGGQVGGGFYHEITCFFLRGIGFCRWDDLW